MKSRRFHQRRFRLIATVALLLIMAAGSYWLMSDFRVNELVAPPAAVGTPAPIEVKVTEEERDYYSYVGTRIRALTAESEALVKLGDARSRNLVELQIRRDRVTLIADQIDAYIAATPTPPRFADAVARYQSGAVQLREGMETATSAFLRFDWDAVARGLDEFAKGSDEINSSYLILKEIVTDNATPHPAEAGLPHPLARVGQVSAI